MFHAGTAFWLNQSCAKMTSRRVFTQPRPGADISRLEIPQRSRSPTPPRCANLSVRSTGDISAVRRREFITLLGGGAAAWPLAARAQQSERVRRVGVLMGIVDGPLGQVYVTALLDELRKLGWTDGRNVSINIRWAPAVPTRHELLQRSWSMEGPTLSLARTLPWSPHYCGKLARSRLCS